MDLRKLRQKIDGIDEKLLALFNDRARVSLDVGKAKREKDQNIYAPGRERELLTRLKAMNRGPMSNESLIAIWREIMSGSMALEKPLRIAYLGADGSNSYVAAVRKFGSRLEYVGVPSIPEVFVRVERGECDYGVVPIENSVEGAVTPTIDMLADSDLQVCAQSFVRIAHALLCKGPVKGIKKIYSNPQVFAQCRQWLSVRFPAKSVRQISVAATTDAARHVAREKGSAAIASAECGRIYGLPIIEENIQDFAHNATRFFVIAKQDASPTGDDRTSIVFSIKDRAGALYAMLAPFAKNGINMTRIESRPIKKKAWDYYFFIDIEGHRNDVKVAKALSQLEEMCTYLRILGSYPA